MLIITRKIGQSFTIGNDITITVVSLAGNQVRIGVDAPKSLPITRDDAVKRSPKGPKRGD